MKIKHLATKILCGILLVAGIAVSGIFTGFAQAASTAVLSVEGELINRIGEMQPGKSYDGVIKVRNKSNMEADVKFYATGYYVEGESYAPVYPEEGDRALIMKWVEFEEEKAKIAPGEAVEVKYTISVPKDAPAGGQYATIMAETEPDESGTIQANARVGQIVISYVSGETTKCGKIQSTSIAGFLVNPPITASAIVENCGNVDLDAEYILKVYPLFSDEEIYTTEENPETKIILPDTRRMHSVSWAAAPSIGIFRAEEIVRINGEETVASKFIVILPIWLIVLILVAIAAIVFRVITISKTRKQATNRPAPKKK
ncbi:MAG: hypothetical protein Q4E47_00340 [Candidatus Saccharibacteria bacterium]|nr:hypothetical protein [Candidatus Saccharibacteria bacterium]